MYCLKSWKERQSIHIVLLFQNATIAINQWLLGLCIYDLSEAGGST